MHGLKQLRLLIAVHVPVEQANVQEILQRCSANATLEDVALVDGPVTRSLVAGPRLSKKNKAKQPVKFTPEKIAEAQHRLAAGESQAAVARALGVSRSSVAHVAQGRRTIPEPEPKNDGQGAAPAPPAAAKKAAAKQPAKPGPKQARGRTAEAEAKAS